MIAENRLVESKWLYAFLIVVVHVALLLTFLTISPATFSKLYGAQKFTSDSAVVYLLSFTFCFSFAFLVGASGGVHLVTALLSASKGLLTSARLKVLLIAGAGLVIVGHLSLFYVGRGIMKTIEGATDAKQEVLLTGTGAPLFLMALTPLFAALVGYALFAQPSRPVRLLAIALGLIVLVFVGIRFLYFERLPLFEFGTPIVWFMFRRLKAQTLILLAVVGIGVFFGLFSLAEYFRSWPGYVSSGLYQNTPSDFIEFMFYRVMGYYITPVNHLSMLTRDNFGHTTAGFYTFRFLLNAPILGGTLSNSIPAFHAMTAKSNGIWLFILDPQYGLNPEFNLFGFYGVAFLDWGWGGLTLAAIFGVIGGTLLTASKNGLALGVFGFPIFLIGFAECPRILYWSHERVFPSIVALVIISIIIPRLAPDGEMQQEYTP